MRLLELRLDGFGRLVNRTFAFVPGFNLIYGPNEAGKTTLQQAILALLYGFYDDGSITAAKRAVAAAWQPWQAEARYAGSLHYVLGDGQAFEVQRNFGPSPTVLLEARLDGAASSDISGKYRRASHGRLFFADTQLGLSRAVFENTCIVRQAELVALEASAAAITDTLTRLAASASTDTNVADAQVALDQALRDIGTDRAWTKPLARARQSLKQLLAERTSVQQTRQGLFSRIVEQHQVEAQVEAMDDEIARWDYLEVAAEVNALRGRLEVLDAAHAEVAQRADDLAQWRRWATFPVHLRDDILRLNDHRERLQAESAEAQPHVERIRRTLTTLNDQIEAGEARVAALEDARSTPVEAYSGIQTLAEALRRAQESAEAAHDRWQRAQARLDEAVQALSPEREALSQVLVQGQAGLAQAHQQLGNTRERTAKATEALTRAEAEWARTGMSEAQFLALEQTVHEIQSGARPVPKPRRGCRLWPFGRAQAQPDPTPTELVIYSQIKPLHTALTQARDETERARKALQDTEDAIRSQYGDLSEAVLSDETFASLATRLDRFLRAEVGYERQQVTVEESHAEFGSAHEAHTQAQAALKAELARLGYASQEAYELQCRRHMELAREESKLAQLRAEASAADREVTAWQNQCQALADAEAELSTLLVQAKIAYTPETLVDALAGFAAGVEHHSRWARAQAAYDATVKHRDALLEQEDSAAMTTSLDALQGRLADLQRQRRDWAQLKAEESAQFYRQKRQQAEQRRLAERERLTRLRDEIERTGESMRHPAEIEEEIHSLEAQIHVLERHRDVLTLASAELTKANQEFQRQFAPKLERLMLAGLSHITHGRYTRASVDPTSLSVSLVAPEHDEAIGVERLSTGTRDLVYLMLRMSIARLLSSTAERLPLLLDDPLVQYDRGRRDRAIASLLEAAEETQVLFFTKDDEVLSRIEGLRERAAQIGIHRLS